MAWKVDGDRFAFEPGEALAAARGVKLASTAGEVEYADAGEEDECIGFTDYSATSTAERISVRLRSRGGVVEATASASISAHAPVKLAAGGKVAPQGTSSAEPVLGMALASASGDNSIIPVLLMIAAEKQNRTT